MLVRKNHVYGGVSFLVVGVAVTLYLSRKALYRSFDYKTNLLLLTLEADFRAKIRKLLIKARNQGIELRVISAHRNCEEQNRLYAKGRTLPGKIVTNAKCGQSAHNYRRAVDVVEFRNGVPIWENPNWEIIGRLGESLGLQWGGRWKSIKDKPHFQDLQERSISQRYS